MRMLQVTDYGSPFAGSFVPMLRAALDEAERRGWSAQAVLPERAREREWLADLGPHRERLLFAPPGSRTEHGRWLAEVVDSEPGPTVLHSHFTVFNIPAVAVARRRPDVSVYWHVHTVLSDRMAARARNRLSLSVVARQVERILCVAPHLADGVRARGAPADKVRYFPNALDVAAYARRSDAERAEVRARLGLPAGVPVLLHFGRDWHAKGGDLFLHALRILRDGGFPDAVAAASRGGDPARELAAELGLTDALHVLDHVPLVARTCTRPPTCSWPPAAARVCRSRCSRRWPAAWAWWPPTSPAITCRAAIHPACRSSSPSPRRWPRPPNGSWPVPRGRRPPRGSRLPHGSAARWTWTAGPGACSSSTRATWPSGRLQAGAGADRTGGGSAAPSRAAPPEGLGSPRR